jgi:hypothetical protein
MKCSATAFRCGCLISLSTSGQILAEAGIRMEQAHQINQRPRRLTGCIASHYNEYCVITYRHDSHIQTSRT